MVKGYEKEYHESQHNFLLNGIAYYRIRGKLAFRKYFKNVNKDAKVLEYGIGLGQNLLHMNNKEGFDKSKFAIEFCKRKGIKVYGNEKDIPDNKYDVVLCCHTLEHLKNPYECLLAMRSKLKKNGRLIVVLPKEEHGKSDFEMDVNQHLHAWNFRTINNLLNISGFRVTKNKFYYGTGFHKLKPIAYFSFGLYEFATNMLGRLLNKAEMAVEAVKTQNS